MRTLDDSWAVMLCDKEWVIIEMLMEKNTHLNICTPSYLHDLILKDNYARFLDFSVQLKHEKEAFGYEISVVDENNMAKTMNFGGIAFEDQYLIALFQNHFELYEKLIESKDEKILLFKEKMKGYHKESTNYNHFTDLNNQLINIQRELTKKNIEIERLLAQTEEMNIALQAANATKDRIFSVIGHDLRASLANIISVMNLMLMDQLTYESLVESDILELLKSSAGNSIILLENLLDWSRCQIGEITYNPAIFNLSDIMREVLMHFKEVARMKRIRFSEVYLDDPLVRVDDRMIETVIRNLISNAIKFSNQDGCIDIKVYIEENQAKLEVRDEGIGMTETRATSLFDSNINSTIPGTLGEKGVGFGLSLCKQFMDQNGGTISISSGLGTGSIFTLAIPMDSSILQK